ncbi:MAG: hypothetical protein JJU00_05565 [Opitutales bacterium]|nr:hypothetical protein [Opitutales bacterium]
MHGESAIRDEAVVVHRGDAGEVHWRYTFLTAGHGWVSALRRKPGKRAQRSAPPDLFDHGDITVPARRSGAPLVLDEFRPVRSHRELAKNAAAFSAAARLANLMRFNLDHSESTESAFRLLVETLDALCARPRPDAALFKAVYRLAREEGYPVREEWAAGLPPQERVAARDLLRQPLDAVQSSADTTEAVTSNLLLYLAGHCHWRLP